MASANSSVEEASKAEIEDGKPRFRWAEVGPNITEAQQEAISKLPPKMTKRCKALMRQLICFSPLEATLSQVLAAWVSIMKPIRADWLVILKQLNTIDHNLYHEVLVSFCPILILFFNPSCSSLSLLRRLCSVFTYILV